MSLLLPDYMYETVYDIPTELFSENGIKLLLLDIDNTFVTYDDEYPTAENIRWFEKMKELGIECVFLSNNVSERARRYSEPLKLAYYSDVKKPSCKYHRIAMQKAGRTAKETMAIGDQIFTDVLAAHFCGCRAVMVNPIKDKKTALFVFKRTLEKPLVALYRSKNKGEMK